MTNPVTGDEFSKWGLGLLASILLVLGGFWSVGSLKAMTAEKVDVVVKQDIQRQLDDIKKTLERIERRQGVIGRAHKGGNGDEN